MKRVIFIGLLIALCACVLLYVYRAQVAHAPQSENGEMYATTTQDASQETVTFPVLPYGEVSLRVGTWGVFEDLRIRPLRIVEDSRCGVDVTCIQAGTVRIELETVSGLGTSTDMLSLGKMLTTEGEIITFVGVSPEAVSTRVLDPDAYILTFTVEKREPMGMSEEVPRAVNSGACYVGGCSSQVCSDTPDVASTCEYKEEYACYAKATCERQRSGACGWSPTPAFNACIDTASRTVYPQ